MGEIMRESAAKNFAPLFRGTIPLMGHSMASAILGLVGQPRLQKYVQETMQTSSMQQKSITTMEAVGEMAADMSKFGLAGVFRGQGIGIAKAIVSLTLFHEGRIWLTGKLKERNVANGWVPAKK